MMSPMFARFEPKMFPNARFSDPDNAAPTLTASSGALVPNATTVKPTANGEMPRERASEDAPRTIKSPPNTRIVMPPTI